MLSLKCSYDNPKSCVTRFNSKSCNTCKYNISMCEYNDSSIYNINTFSVKKSVFESEISKVDFLSDFIAILSLQYGGIAIVEYTFKSDLNDDDYYIFRVVSMLREK